MEQNIQTPLYDRMNNFLKEFLNSPEFYKLESGERYKITCHPRTYSDFHREYSYRVPPFPNGPRLNEYELNFYGIPLESNPLVEEFTMRYLVRGQQHEVKLEDVRIVRNFFEYDYRDIHLLKYMGLVQESPIPAFFLVRYEKRVRSKKEMNWKLNCEVVPKDFFFDDIVTVPSIIATF